jgi:O-acetyl-ADP-ribose deacetylase (regulator of RNase III)
MQLRVVRGDITHQRVDAIVTAANADLRGGGGVDVAVHRAAGPELLRACRPLAPCPPGSAVVTPAFDLAPVRWVIHAVGPIYSGPEDAAILASAYTSALRCADQVAARSVAFPLISTGVYGYPVKEAATVSVQALLNESSDVHEVLLVAFDEQTALAWESAIDVVGRRASQ